MRPICLKIAGINSFNKEQKIDFEKLLKDGIFGIFGNTGSGKTTIIDAITLALYGKITRYDTITKGKKFINLNREFAEVEFTFAIRTENIDNIYTAYRRFKTGKEDISRSDIVRLSMKKSNENDIIISDKITDFNEQIINIIGIEYTDFIRAVVLPQGKFSEFLLLRNEEKRKMLQRMFGLEKYGVKLINKINERKNIQEKITQNLERDILYYGDLSEENIEKNKLELEKINDELDNTTKIKNDKENKYSIFEQILKNKLEYKKYAIKLDELIKCNANYEDFKCKLEKARYADGAINTVKELEKINNEYKNNKQEKDNFREIFLIKEQNYIEADKMYNNAKEKMYKDKPLLENKKKDIEECIQILNEKEKILNEIKEKNKLIEENDKEINKLNTKIKGMENEIKEIENNIKEINKFNENNIEKMKNKEEIEKINKFNEQKTIEEENIQNIQKEIKKCDIDIQKEKENLLINEINIINDNKILEKIITNNYANLMRLSKQQDEKIKEINSYIDEKMLSLKIYEKEEIIEDILHNFNDTGICPICGNIEKDRKISEKEVYISKEEYKNIQSNINEKKEELKEIEGLEYKKYIERLEEYIYKYKMNSNIENEFLFKNNEILSKISNYKEKIRELEKDKEIINVNIKNLEQIKQEKNIKLLKNIQNKENIINKLYEINEYNENNDYIKIYEEIKKLEKQISDNQSILIKNMNEKDIITSNKNNMQNNIQNIQNENIRLEFFIDENKKYISEKDKKIEIICGDKNPNDILKDIKENIRIIIKNESEYSEEKDKLNKQKNEYEKKYNEYETKVKMNEKSIKELENNIEIYMKDSIFKTIGEINESYAPKEKQDYYIGKINSYEDKEKEYKSNIKRLADEYLEMKNTQNVQEYINDDMTIENIQKIKDTLEEEKKLIANKEKEFIANIATKKENIKKEEKDLENMKKCKKEYKKEMKKLDTIKDISELNRGGSFIEYVANKRLKIVVQDANIRLKKMSSGKYSIELKDSEFKIIDHYNGSEERSVNSLSGGEMFMASLSLALALSSKIQMKNKAPLEVFFLDEGFGTLDSNLLDTVIQILEELNTENVGVGIITHVEEIKARINNKIITEIVDNSTVIKMG